MLNAYSVWYISLASSSNAELLSMVIKTHSGHLGYKKKSVLLILICTIINED